MTEYRMRDTGEVKNQGEIRKLFPNTSLPRTWNNNTLDFLGVDPVTPVDKPKPSSDLKVVVRNGVEQDADGNWMYAWTEENKFANAEEEAAYLEIKTKEVDVSARLQRNRLLEECDHWAVSDTPDMTEEQIQYRQALRNLTDHPKWPHLESTDWPKYSGFYYPPNT